MACELPASQLLGWREFARYEPFGPAAWDARIGWVLAVLVNALTGKPSRPSDFEPPWRDSAPVQQSFEEMHAIFKDWKHAHHR